MPNIILKCLDEWIIYILVVLCKIVASDFLGVVWEGKEGSHFFWSYEVECFLDTSLGDNSNVRWYKSMDTTIVGCCVAMVVFDVYLHWLGSNIMYKHQGHEHFMDLPNDLVMASMRRPWMIGCWQVDKRCDHVTMGVILEGHNLQKRTGNCNGQNIHNDCPYIGGV